MAKSAWTDSPALASPTPVDFRAAHDKLTSSEDESAPPTLPLRGIFDIKSKHYDVVLERDRISWSLILPTMQSGESSELKL